MVLKVKVNLPNSKDELMNKASETMAKILIKKLQPKEVDQLIEALKDDNLNFNF